MTETLKAEYELGEFLDKVANQELATWNKERSLETLNAFVMMRLDSDRLANTRLN